MISNNEPYAARGKHRRRHESYPNLPILAPVSATGEQAPEQPVGEHRHPRLMRHARARTVPLPAEVSAARGLVPDASTVLQRFAGG